MPLSKQQIQAILRKGVTPQSKYPTPEQKGPLRHWNKGRVCNSPGCGSQTYLTVDGEPLCLAHAARKLNDIIIFMNEQRRQELNAV